MFFGLNLRNVGFVGAMGGNTPPIPTFLRSAAFSYIGSDQSWVVPAGVTLVTGRLWAGGGGEPATSTSYGGIGHYVSMGVPVSPGDTLSIVVGQSGTQVAAYGYGGGGPGGADISVKAGGGGGRSAIIYPSILLVAGGGGGGAFGTNGGGSSLPISGGYGALTGLSGASTPLTQGYRGGTGATQLLAGGPGAGGNATAGVSFSGGSGGANIPSPGFAFSLGGGGGGGYFGGGGGGAIEQVFVSSFVGGGGGGSSITSGGINAVNTGFGNANWAGDPYWNSSAANPGQPGYVVLTYMSP